MNTVLCLLESNEEEQLGVYVSTAIEEKGK